MGNEWISNLVPYFIIVTTSYSEKQILPKMEPFTYFFTQLHFKKEKFRQHFWIVSIV